MSHSFRALIGVVVFFLLACGGLPTPPSLEKAAPALPEVQTLPTAPPPPQAPPPARTAPGPTDPPVALDPGVPADPIGAYAADCHATLRYEDPDDGETKTRCGIPFDQMCAPDQSGCYADSTRCEAACVAPCDACQEQCAGPCDTCAAACAPGDKACRMACATTREQCAQTCMKQREGCLDSCNTVANRCTAAFEEKRLRQCPNCAEIGACQWKKPACKPSDYPNDAPECFAWCYQE